VLWVPHAFGGAYPTTDAGPGQVALWTGEFATTATDVTVPGYGSDLSISRTHSTYAGEPTVAAGVFGPGWTASLDGPEAGFAGYQLLDNTRLDGTLVLLSPEGTPMVFAPATNWARRTGASLTTGTWAAVDADTALLRLKTELSGTGSATTFTVTDPDGVATKFQATSAPTVSAAAVFAPAAVAEPGMSGQTTYLHDAQGRVTRILAPLAAGMSAADCPVTGSLQPGCRALQIAYATTTTATATAPGDVAGQVQKISLRTYNPTKAGGAGMDDIVVAQYEYTADHRLVSVTDPRTNLSTSYGYDSDGRLASITDPGLAPTSCSTTARRRSWPGSSATDPPPPAVAPPPWRPFSTAFRPRAMGCPTCPRAASRSGSRRARQRMRPRCSVPTSRSIRWIRPGSSPPTGPTRRSMPLTPVVTR
jgi:YD repeat-containing protein